MSHKACPHILLIEDDRDTSDLIRETLSDHFGEDRITHAECAADTEALDLHQFEMVLCDLNLPDASGLELIDRLLARREDLPVIMVTSEAGLDTAMTAIRKGAYDYIVKIGDYLLTIPLFIEKNLQVWQTKQENLRLQAELVQTLQEVNIKNRQLEEAVEQLEQLASTDPLTGLANRRHVQQSLERSFAESTRYGTDLACLMIDLDKFKRLNDTLGHQQGDRLLQTCAKVLNANCRRSDVAGRYGGDEFVVLLPHTGPELAQQVARRIQQQFRNDVAALGPEHAVCSMSVGLACVSISKPASADQLVALADAALYRAKQSGAARVCMHEAPPSLTTPAFTPQSQPFDATI